MLTLIGVVLLVVGLSDLGAAAVIQSQQRQPDPSGLGQEQPLPVVRLLRMIGITTVIVGAVLIAVGLAG